MTSPKFTQFIEQQLLLGKQPKEIEEMLTKRGIKREIAQKEIEIVLKSEKSGSLQLDFAQVKTEVFHSSYRPIIDIDDVPTNITSSIEVDSKKNSPHISIAPGEGRVIQISKDQTVELENEIKEEIADRSLDEPLKTERFRQTRLRRRRFWTPRGFLGNLLKLLVVILLLTVLVYTLLSPNEPSQPQSDSPENQSDLPFE